MDAVMNVVPTVFVVNDFYVPYLSVTLRSIMENAGHENRYRFFVLHLGLSSPNMSILKEQVGSFDPARFSLDFINCSEYFVPYDFPAMIRDPAWSQEVFLKLLIPWIFKQYEKVLYLDSDVVVCCDLVDLYEKFDPVENPQYILAATPDLISISWFHFLQENPSEEIGKRVISEIIKTLPNPDHYFCAGVLSINTSGFRAQISLKELLEHAATKRYNLQEQDLLNILCANKIQHLSAAYGYQVYNHRIKLDIIPELLREEHLAAQNDLKIIHFICKPWTRFFHVEYFYEWWKYATRTPFIHVITDRMEARKLIGYDTYQGL
jgi:lipopolysaccharide biosynthesis glycosyltransferase